ncbi:caspase family protein [Bradyrhizobium lablabi]|uniref:caspase family protein n=1 Tax=Bradyrhizobium lablabi TaxID=722472 RepID=UPI001BAC3A1A|nr:caspase family protein [Bradyrhizobium lablabi]MBR0695615.1 caspase family protein [Bradyrhizobium lablabi]
MDDRITPNRKLAYLAALMTAATCLLLFTTASAQVNSLQRVALIIGNGAYHHVAALTNPPNDAIDLERTFLRIGFDVTRVSDVDRSAFLRALRAFEDKVATADIAVIFYAGHGIEVEGSNFLIPVDANLARDIDVEDEAVPLTRVLQAVRDAKRLRLVFVDACRANSFETRMKRTFATRAVGRGLNNLQPAGSTIVAYSAKQGTLAEDGSGRNSPFASSLLTRLEQPGLEINFLFRAVRDDVLRSTNMRQEPYTYGSLGSERIYLNGDGEPSATDEVAWNFLDRTKISELQRFVRQFPESRFRRAAEEAIGTATDDTKFSAPLLPSLAQTEAAGAAVDKKTQLAALPSVSEQGIEPKLTVALQDELRRVGCNTGAVDGEWGASSQRAIELFNKHTGAQLDTRTASVAALDAVKSKVGRICPLVCDFGYRAEGNGCLKITCPKGQQLNESGLCARVAARSVPEKHDRLKLKRQPPLDARTETAPPRLQAAGRIICDNQGCRPIAKGCRIEPGWVAGAKNRTQQYQVCP